VHIPRSVALLLVALVCLNAAFAEAARTLKLEKAPKREIPPDAVTFMYGPSRG